MNNGKSKYDFFSKKELSCRCGCGLGEDDMSPSFMIKLVRLRLVSGISMPVSSAVRCVEHNYMVSHTGSNGPHVPKVVPWENIRFGHAIDINVWGESLFRLLDLIHELFDEEDTFTGIGLNQTGPYHERFLHLDDLPDGFKRPRPWIWTY